MEGLQEQPHDTQKSIQGISYVSDNNNHKIMGITHMHLLVCKFLDVARISIILSDMNTFHNAINEDMCLVKLCFMIPYLNTDETLVRTSIVRRHLRTSCICLVVFITAVLVARRSNGFKERPGTVEVDHLCVP